MNTTLKNIVILLAAISGIMALPYIGAWINFKGDFGPHYFDFPPLSMPPKPGFNWIIFIGVALIFALILMIYIAPTLFGFKKPEKPNTIKVQKAPLPVWFWIGLVMWGGTLAILWGKFEEPKLIINWACVPLFWGFTLLLDGLVYRRTGGRSLVATHPRELVGMGVASIGGWLIFEWLNFFVNDNWDYPKGDLLPEDEFTIYAVIGSSGLMPMVFEWYSLLDSFEGFRNRFTNGPKLNMGKWVTTAILIVFSVGLFFISYAPNYLFGLLWLAPLFILAAVLEKLEIWTPFRSIKNGNWAPLLTLNIGYLIQGLLCECWNYFSGVHTADGVISINPDYWQYSVPFVDRFHLFEMPVVGFLGYMPFGIYCGLWWVAFAYLLNIPLKFSEKSPYI